MFYNYNSPLFALSSYVASCHPSIHLISDAFQSKLQLSFLYLVFLHALPCKPKPYHHGIPFQCSALGPGFSSDMPPVHTLQQLLCLQPLPTSPAVMPQAFHCLFIPGLDSAFYLDSKLHSSPDVPMFINGAPILSLIYSLLFSHTYQLSLQALGSYHESILNLPNLYHSCCFFLSSGPHLPRWFWKPLPCLQFHSFKPYCMVLLD